MQGEHGEKDTQEGENEDWWGKLLQFWPRPQRNQKHGPGASAAAWPSLAYVLHALHRARATAKVSGGEERADTRGRQVAGEGRHEEDGIGSRGTDMGWVGK